MNADNLAILNKHLTVENQHDWPATLATLHPDCLFEDTTLGLVYKGHEGADRYYHLWWGAFDLIVKSERRHFTEDGCVISEARYTGTHIGDFYGIPATGRPIDFKLAVIISFRDGLLSGERFYYDARTLLQQLNVSDIPNLKV